MLTKALSRLQDQERRLHNEVAKRTRESTLAIAELEKIALRDGLTGLFNHRYFQESLAAELARAARHQQRVSLIFLGVDHFKNFNDLNGHPKGDALLVTLVKILTTTGDLPEVRFHGRRSDITARYGGEEFVVILPQTDRAGATFRAECLRENVANYSFDNGSFQRGGRVTVNIGVGVFPDDAFGKVELIEAADKMLFLAKRSGRNNVKVFGVDGN